MSLKQELQKSGLKGKLTKILKKSDKNYLKKNFFTNFAIVTIINGKTLK